MSRASLFSAFIGLAAVVGWAVPGESASAQCAANNGNYVITQTSGGAIEPGTTDVGNHTDDTPLTVITLPFSWSFYGTAYTQVQLGSNGDLSFGASGGSTAFGNLCLPTTTFTAPTMCPYWDDLRTDASGSGIFTSTTGVSPNRVFNIEWRATYFAGGQTLNMEVRLFESQTRFDFVYGTMNAGGSGGTIGCQQSGAAGSRNTQFACDSTTNDAPAAGTVLSFDCASTSAPSCSLSLLPTTGASGDSTVATARVIEGTPASPPYSVTLDASAINAGTVTLYDDGPGGGHGDAVAGDLIFTNTITVGPGTPNGNAVLVSTVSDSANPVQSSTCSAIFAVNTVALAGTGTATPAANVPLGASSLLQVNVTPATGPASTNIQVSADLTNIGGSATQQFYDDGTHGDVTAGDNHYSFSATIAGVGGNYNLPFTVSDAQGRSANGTIAIGTYDPTAVWDEANNGGGDAGDLPASAQTVDRPAPVTQIRGTMGGTGNDADMYVIHMCDPANFSASTVGGTTIDTQLWLFSLDGRGIVMDDDQYGGATLQSQITNQFTASLTPGDYLLAITGYNQDANDSSNQLLFVNTIANCSGGSVYRCEHGPDGPGGANPIDHWDTGGLYSGAYTIFLTGVGGGACGGQSGSCCTANMCTIVASSGACSGTFTPGGTCPSSCGMHCGSADFNCDGDVGTDQDIEGFFACLAGNCPALPCISSADFNGDGDVGTDQDIEAFFRVLAGGNC